MELVFAIIDELRQEAINEVLNPPEDRRSEFNYGRVHGWLFGLGLIEERLKAEIEINAQRQHQREREF